MRIPSECRYQGVQNRRLTADEERALAVRIADGDAEASDTLIRHNFRFAALLAKRASAKHGLDISDCEEAAMEALRKAATKFDPDRGTFANCVYSWVRHEIRELLIATRGPFRVPNFAIRLLGKLERGEPVTRRANESPKQLTKNLQYAWAAAAAFNAISLDEPDGDQTIGETIPHRTWDKVYSLDDYDVFKGACLSLCCGGFLVMVARYPRECVKPRSQARIAKDLEMTVPEVARLERASIQLIRNAVNSDREGR